MVTTSLSSCRMRTSGRRRQGYDSALTRAYCAFSRLTGKTKTRGRSERCATYWSCAEIEASRGTWAMTSQAWRCSARGQKRWTARSFTVGEERDPRQERKEDEGTQEIAEVREARQAPERAQRPEGMQEQGGHDLRHRAPEMGVAAQMRIGRAAEVADEPSRIHDEQGHGRHRGDAPPEPAPLREG